MDDAPYLLSADGRVVVRRLDGQHVGVWRISASGVSDAGLAEGDLLIGSIAVSPDSQWLATGSMRTRRKDLEHLSSTGVQLWRIDGSAPQKAGKIETENPVHPDFCTSRVLSVSGWTAGDSYWAIDRNGTARFVYQMPANLDGREPNGSTARPDPEHDREFQVVTYAGKQGSGISVIYVLVVIEGDSVTSPRSVELPATPSRSVQLVALQGRAPLVSLSCPETRELHIARSNGGDAEPVGPYRSVVEYRRPNTSADEVYLKAWRWDDDGADIIRVDEDPFADNDEECGLLFHLVGHLPPDALLSRLHPCGTRFGVGDSAEGVSVWLMDADGDVVIAGETIHWPASPAEPREWPRVTVDAHWEVPQGTVLQPGDEVTLVVRANNAGTGTIHHLVGMLSADPAEAVAGAPQPVVLGSIEPGETVTRHLQLVATEAMVRRPTTWTLTWQDKFGFALKPQTWTAETGDGAPLLDVDAAWVEDLAASDGDGILQAGEIGWLVLRLTNRGESATPAQMAVGVELAGSDDVSLLDDAANSAVMLDPLPPGESAEARFRIGVRPRCEAKWFEARVSGVGLIHPRFVCGNHKPAQLPVCVPIGYSLRADSERRFRELLHTDHNDPEAWRAYLDSAESLYASADPLPPSWQSWVAERALGCAIALQDLPEVVRWADRELAVASDASRRIFLQQSKCMAQILLGRVADAEATLSQLDAPSENLTESLSFARAIRTTTGRRPAPDFTLPDLTDEKHTVTLSAFRGRVVIVNFWAAWCEPCLKLMNGDLKDLQSTFAERGLTIISIGQPWRGESAFRQAEEAKKWGFDWLKVYDTTSETRRAWKVTTIPHLVLIDRAGNVVLEGQDGSMPFVRQFLETECPADAADPDVPR
ncbi:MAG: redoxin family protein [Planctomycetota bacterium]